LKVEKNQIQFLKKVWFWGFGW